MSDQRTARSRITIADLHSAIESLAISQAQIGIAVLELVRQQPPASVTGIVEDLEQAVGELQELAQTFLDTPYDH